MHLLSVFSYSDWARNPNDRHFTTGFVVFLGANPITWIAKKQSTVSRSSTEAEYRALATTTAELSWLQQLLKNLCVCVSSPVLYCDNQSTLQLACNPVFDGQTKYIEVDLHFVRERVASKAFCFSLYLQFSN